MSKIKFDEPQRLTFSHYLLIFIASIAATFAVYALWPAPYKHEPVKVIAAQAYRSGPSLKSNARGENNFSVPHTGNAVGESGLVLRNPDSPCPPLEHVPTRQLLAITVPESCPGHPLLHARVRRDLDPDTFYSLKRKMSENSLYLPRVNASDVFDFVRNGSWSTSDFLRLRGEDLGSDGAEMLYRLLVQRGFTEEADVLIEKMYVTSQQAARDGTLFADCPLFITHVATDVKAYFCP